MTVRYKLLFCHVPHIVQKNEYPENIVLQTTHVYLIFPKEYFPVTHPMNNSEKNCNKTLLTNVYKNFVIIITKL